MEQPDAQSLLQLLDRMGDGGARHLQVVGSLGKAAQFDDAGQQAHGSEPVHRRAP
jgi:hypothetical protein